MTKTPGDEVRARRIIAAIWEAEGMPTFAAQAAAGNADDQPIMKAVLAALTPMSSGDCGAEWRMVPVEPTDAMVSAGMVAAQLESLDKPFLWSRAVRAAHRAMLAASPAPKEVKP